MLGLAIESFTANLSALREFVMLIGSLLETHQKEIMTKNSKDLTPLLVVNAIAACSPLSPFPVEELEKHNRAFGAEMKIVQDGDDFRLFIPGSEGRRFQSAFNALNAGSNHRSLLYRSSLISLVSSAEWFLSQIIRQHFTAHPDASGTKEKTLTLEELLRFASIEDAQRHFTDLRIEDIVRGPLEDWLKFLSAQMKLHMSYITPHKNALTEVFQRRNVMVHNNGIVHSSYISKVDPELRKGVVVGALLLVEPQYLERAIDLVELNFTLIAAELWKKTAPEDGQRAEILCKLALERLTSEHWMVGEGISFFVMNDKQLPERDQVIGLLNYWQSVKWQGRFGEVQAQIEKSDFSAKDELFQLARFVLLDDFKQAWGLIPQAIKSKKLTPVFLSEWPIFRGLRKTDEYTKFLDEQKAELNPETPAKTQVGHAEQPITEVIQ